MKSSTPKVGNKGPKRDFATFILTVNTQKDWYTMSEEDRSIFGQWFLYMFGEGKDQWFQDTLMYRVPFIDKRAEVDKATDDTRIEHFEWTAATEIGENKNRYHAHVTIQVVSERLENSAVMINVPLIRKAFFDTFGYKCHISSRRAHNDQLRMEWYTHK